MPAPNIKGVILNPQTVNTGQQFTITVDAESLFLWNDLDTFTWDIVETRNLTFDDLDDTE